MEYSKHRKKLKLDAQSWGEGRSQDLIGLGLQCGPHNMGVVGDLRPALNNSKVDVLVVDVAVTVLAIAFVDALGQEKLARRSGTSPHTLVYHHLQHPAARFSKSLVCTVALTMTFTLQLWLFVLSLSLANSSLHKT